jgi:hypothetical protein
MDKRITITVSDEVTGSSRTLAVKLDHQEPIGSALQAMIDVMPWISYWDTVETLHAMDEDDTLVASANAR